VGDREGDVLDAQLCGELAGDAAETKCRLAAGQVCDFDVAPAHAVAPAGAERFHRRFFYREASSESLELVLVPLAVGDLGRREEALDERPAVALNGRLNPVNLRNVQSHPDNHACSR